VLVVAWDWQSYELLDTCLSGTLSSPVGPGADMSCPEGSRYTLTGMRAKPFPHGESGWTVAHPVWPYLLTQAMGKVQPLSPWVCVCRIR
jgi:hypothetical protein